MRWRKREIWKVGIALAGMLLLLVLMVWVPASAAGVYEGVSGLGLQGTTTVQATPTEDATITALEEKQLTLQVEQLQNQNGWLADNSTALIAAFTTLVVALFGISQWAIDRRGERRKEREAQDKESEDRQAAQDKELEDRKAEREKRAEERFQKVVEGLGSERTEAKMGAAVTLRTFLQPGYERFYRLAFDLAVGHLRLTGTSELPNNPNTPIPATPLRQAFIIIFREAFPLARDELKKPDSPFLLDASDIQLDNAYLKRANLRQAWMPHAFLRYADLSETDLSDSKLSGADLSGADLSKANLSKAKLSGANLSKAKLNGADLSGAKLKEINLGVTPYHEEVLSLEGTDLRGVKGLDEEQLKAFKAKGAIIDEAFTTSSSQPTVSSLPPDPRNDVQALSASSDSDASSATSSTN